MEIEKIVGLIKNEIENSEIAKKITELDSKLVEMKKTVESVVIELTYIKDELRELRGDKKKPFEIKTEKEQKATTVTEKKDTKIQVKNTEERKLETVEKKAEEDLIICD
jgi:regulator of replication initiation timing